MILAGLRSLKTGLRKRHGERRGVSPPVNGLTGGLTPRRSPYQSNTTTEGYIPPGGAFGSLAGSFGLSGGGIMGSLPGSLPGSFASTGWVVGR